MLHRDNLADEKKNLEGVTSAGKNFENGVWEIRDSDAVFAGLI